MDRLAVAFSILLHAQVVAALDRVLDVKALAKILAKVLVMGLTLMVISGVIQVVWRDAMGPVLVDAKERVSVHTGRTRCRNAGVSAGC